MVECARRGFRLLSRNGSLAGRGIRRRSIQKNVEVVDYGIEGNSICTSVGATKIIAIVEEDTLRFMKDVQFM